MSDTRFVVWDPTGIIGDVSFENERAAIKHREKMDNAYGWEFRIKKEFSPVVVSGPISDGCIPPGTVPTREQRIIVMEQRDAHLEREIRILTERRTCIQHMIAELKKECS